MRQDDANPREGSHDRSLRRLGTFNILEQGHHRLSQNSNARPQFSTSMPRASSSSSSGDLTSRPTYTLRQAFFIVSGGLIVETQSFRSEPYLTIKPAGAIELARCGQLQPVDKDVINDKSKADPITKVLVCVQAGRFIVPSIARIAQNLPLALLEIHVLTNVIIALLMYLFWFG